MSHHILIVDDDQLLRRSLSLQLEQAGYRTSTAANAEDALAMLEREHPDLILLDVGLPGMDGLEALRRIHQDRDIPVIFVTARRREFDEVLGLELGGRWLHHQTLQPGCVAGPCEIGSAPGDPTIPHQRSWIRPAFGRRPDHRPRRTHCHHRRTSC